MIRVLIMLCSTILLVSTAYAESTSMYSSSFEIEPTPHHGWRAHHHSEGDSKGRNSFPQQRPATGSRVFIFSPRAHAWAAYNEEGERVNTGRASGGRSFCRDIRRPCRTIVGTFHVISKGGASCRSNIYPVRTGGGAPMPYCMRFSKKGYAIHGASHVPSYNASHGCIRVSPSAARWLSQNFVRNGTTVKVLSY